MAISRSPLIVGVFRDETAARNAVKALQDAGFSNDQIGIALREGGMVTKTLLQDLMKLGVPQDQASYYESEYRAGRVIVSVRPDGQEQEARNILMNYGAYDYTTQAGYTQPGPYDTDEKRAFKLREEQLQAEKRSVESGEVRLYKEVVTEQKSIDVPVTHEEVVVERHSYTEGRPSDIPVGQDEAIRIPVREEQVNVTKTPVETGEVTIDKRTVEEKQRLSDTVKREELRLEREGNPPIRNKDDLGNA